jgi:hypothetical protein
MMNTLCKLTPAQIALLKEGADDIVAYSTEVRSWALERTPLVEFDPYCEAKGRRAEPTLKVLKGKGFIADYEYLNPGYSITWNAQRVLEWHQANVPWEWSNE